ncbi:S8 family serine peptidase [Rhizobium laguerreae]|uniref:S8 family serine peptidase n=1 Tax=Rhizobium laguerreae TaxID=1076926 RepID=UPI001C920C86|nr:S8 family serine peptidase [Rhizobium laguerreae]MBY3168856.1 S8 family serine peptidase [Rhizobium laguerreae]
MRQQSLASLIAAISLCSPVLAAEPDAAVVNFTYQSGEISKDFIEWVASVGARKPVKASEGRKLDDYVKAICGSVADINQALFRRTLEKQGIEVPADGTVSPPEGGVLLLPPCLPTPKAKPTARVVLSGERLWDYYESSPLVAATDVEGVTPVSPGEVIASQADNNLGGYFSDVISSIDLNDASQVQEFVDAYLRGKTDATRPQGEIAWDAFLAGNALVLSGADADVTTKALATTLDKAGEGQKSTAVGQAVEAAIKRWGGKNAISSENWTQVSQSLESGTATSSSKNITWFDPAPDPSKDPTKLQPGDIIVTVTPADQTVQIPVDGMLLSKAASENAVAYLKKNPPPPPSTAANTPSPDVTLMDTKPMDAVDGSSCTNASYEMWGTSQFARDFGNAAMRTRMLSYRTGHQATDASIVVIDSGFVKVRERGAFRDESFTEIADLLHEQTAPPELQGRRIHGTSVAGLALGGPHLWGLSASLGLRLTITPATIYEVRLINNVPTATFQFQWMKDAIEGAGDIYNISFASKNAEQMDVFENYLGAASGKLFVVAAGNNKMNNDTKGGDIADIDIFPQRFGGNVQGPNLITVAAFDGTKLAGFSNYSSRYVSIAAPGCAISSWKPAHDDSRYEEQRFTGTSYAAPIVAHLAGMIKSLMPAKHSSPAAVRARILASADLVKNLQDVEDGRLLNPIKAISIHEDVVEVEQDGVKRLLTGTLQLAGGINDLCVNAGTPEGSPALLKFATDPTPEGENDSIIYFLRNGILENGKVCKRREATLAFEASDGSQELIKLSDVRDIVFKVR